MAIGNLGDMKKVELLYWDGCPSHPEALRMLQGLGLDVTMREVRTESEAHELGFPGSPTIRIDGRDVDEEGARGRPALTCRIYYLLDGRVSPVPSREQVEEALG